MLDARIYRTGLIAVALAVIVLAFSLQNEPGAAHATLTPDAFNAQSALNQTNLWASRYPNRSPGSVPDQDLASEVAGDFRQPGFTVSTDVFTARAASGTNTLENVAATRPGTGNGTIVVVAPRDHVGPGAAASLSGTATLVELASVMSGETLSHTIVLASTDGSDGGAGVARLIRALPGPIDAVIVLGDMIGTHVHQPVVVPWSNGVGFAPLQLRNTVAQALGSQAGLKPGGSSLIGQLAHLAFPLTTTAQGAFGAAGVPAITLSASGERPAAADEPTSGPAAEAQLNGLGRTVLASISALDNAPAIPAPTAYMLFSGKVVPPWAMRLFVLVLILPVLGVAIDGLARANRRGYSVMPPAMSVLGAAVPFGLAALLIVAARLVHVISAAPPGPVRPEAVSLKTGDIALLVVVGLVILGAFGLRRWIAPRATVRSNRVKAERNAAAGPVVAALMCAVALALWVKNPFAALLVVPALHLWMWVADSDARTDEANPGARIHPIASTALVVIGLAPAVVVAVYYAISLRIDPAGLGWTGILMLAGGQIGVLAALEWCVLIGCTISVVILATRAVRAPAPEQLPITVRGPITYAGPGSLGGTKSALRR
ncbi:MAG TPA: hypothetical protein VG410_11525 [Solirubrobacteraceae bacterium]|nr:hypothetical protein [Solirubrobacteraceae bacterium]